MLFNNNGPLSAVVLKLLYSTSITLLLLTLSACGGGSSKTPAQENHSPVASNGNIETNRNLHKSITMTASDPDEGSTLSFSVQTNALSGRVTISGNSATYTPNVNYVGSDRFTFKVTDEQGKSDTAIISINVKQTKVKILPLGDSITHGRIDHFSYRYKLWELLKGQDVDFDFIGSINHRYQQGGETLVDWPNNDFDKDHEGHTGERADEISGDLSEWLQGYTPDIALVHLGTNDIIQGQSNTSTITDLREVINKLLGDNPNMVIFLAKIIRKNDRVSEVLDLNIRLDGLAGEFENVKIVDMYSAVGSNLYDGTHPNGMGENLMAGKWFDALEAYSGWVFD